MSETQSAIKIKLLFQVLELLQQNLEPTKENFEKNALCIDCMSVVHFDEKIAIVKYDECGNFYNVIDLQKEEIITIIEPL